MRKNYLLTAVLTMLLLLTADSRADAEDILANKFSHPPASARPWVYWFWLNGNITHEGITADLEAMKRVGIGGVLIMEVDQGTPKGAAAFGGPEWRELFKHVCSEAHRLGLEVNMNNDAGWCGSGGPWITPELAMQKITWAETNLVGPKRFTEKLPEPKVVGNYYRDITVLAFPTPEGDDPKFRIEDIEGKGAFVPHQILLKTSWPETPANALIAREKILDITSHLSADGKLAWDVPEGKWTILRLGHTLTGKDNHPAPEAGRGLESDKLSKQATDVMFDGLMGKLIADSKPLAGKTLVSTHIDSWETGSQNWTPHFREEFQQLRGYDLWKFLPVMTGRVVESREVSERFLWDVRRTVSDLIIQNYADRFHERAQQNGLRLSIEGYDATPFDDMTLAGRADEPMAEFWSWGYNTAYSCFEMSSAAHIYGKKILGAEAFTATDGEKWQLHPASIKALGDWAFCQGINRFVFHRYAMQPWLNRPPGMSMGPWGLHYERTQTWWEQSKAWHEYLARCQYLLQQGLFVADICYLEPENSPERFQAPVLSSENNTPERPKYNFDGCTPEVMLTRMKVKDGRLVLPDGMSYRLLVLPATGAMTPQLLGKIKELVQAGATIIGAPPEKSPSLSDYPKCDTQVIKLAAELWGDGKAPAAITELSRGKGRIFRGGVIEKKPELNPDAAHALDQAKWIWHREGNPASAAPVGKRSFRRLVEIEKGKTIKSAHIAITADNSFDLFVNGQRAGSGYSFNQTYYLDVSRLLKAGTNVLAVTAENGGNSPNPAGLIAGLNIQFSDGSSSSIYTDKTWSSIVKPKGRWRNDVAADAGWHAAKELGSLGMQPWGAVDKQLPPPDWYPDTAVISDLMKQLGVPPDFEADQHLRYIHKHEGNTEIYFVANPEEAWSSANCTFRVSGKTPELWNPMTGETKTATVFHEANGRTELPLSLEPSGSVFVIFREKTKRDGVVAMTRDGKTILPDGNSPVNEAPTSEVLAGKTGIHLLASEAGRYEIKTALGKTLSAEVKSVSEMQELSGPWEVQFQPNRGAPERVTLPGLISWSEHTDPGVKYFSGTATYSKKFSLSSPSPGQDRRLSLDLGKVQVMAEVKLNGRDLGILWKAPYRIDITDAAVSGENTLEIKVVNLWINRMIGDEQLAEDSSRNSNGTLKEWPSWLNGDKPSPTGRFAFTSWKLWAKDAALQESGLLGPVRLTSATLVEMR